MQTVVSEANTRNIKTWIGGLLFASFVLMLLFDVKVLSSHNWDARKFILERSPDVPLEQGWNIGYDAQWYYQIALDPFGAVSELDQPAFRYQRIVYPLIVRLLSLGVPSLIPWMMLTVNLISAGLGCVSLGLLLSRRKSSPVFALVWILSLGYLLTIRMDLLEPLALAFALIGWLAYENERTGLAVLLFALSGLTKEVGLVFPAALILWEILRREWKQVYALAASILPYLIWYMILFTLLGSTEAQVAQSSLLLIPFSGLRYLEEPVSRAVAGIWVLLPAMAAGIFAAIDIRNRNSDIRRDAILVLAQIALIATMPRPTWADPLAILRVGLGFLVAVLLWLASSHPRVLPYAAALWLPSGLLLFLVPGML